MLLYFNFVPVAGAGGAVVSVRFEMLIFFLFVWFPSPQSIGNHRHSVNLVEREGLYNRCAVDAAYAVDV